MAKLSKSGKELILEGVRLKNRKADYITLTCSDPDLGERNGIIVTFRLQAKTNKKGKNNYINCRGAMENHGIKLKGKKKASHGDD